MTTTYRYLATAIDGTRLAELPLGEVEWSEMLNDAGELTATLDLRARTRAGVSLADSLIASTAPRKTRLWVERDDTLVWSGIIWRRRRPRGSTGKITLQALSTWAYWQKRRITETQEYISADQLAVVRDLITWAQAQPGGDLGVVVGAETSGVTITRQPLCYGWEYRELAEVVAELAGGDGGFDVAVVPSKVNDEPVDTLTLYYPRRGRRVSDSELLFFRAGSSGGNLIDYELDEEGWDSATTLYGIGAGEGESMVRAVASRTDLLDAGYPLTESTVSYKSINDGTALLALTAAEVDRIAPTPQVWSIDVDPDDISVPFGAWTVGDDARIVIDSDDRFPAGTNGEPGLETTVRIVGHTVRVPDDAGPDEVTLTLGPARG